MIPFEWVEQAEARIVPHIVRPPLLHDATRNLYIKWENRQRTGSFKVRGALNKILILSDSEREAGLVTVSSGNYGKGVARAGQLTGAHVTCFLPLQTQSAKVDAIRSLDAEVVLISGNYDDAENAGMAFAEENHQTWISPYNDEQVIAGQGTVGLEIMQTVTRGSDLTCLVPVGGGGLIAGIGVALQHLNPRPRLVGVQPNTTPFMYELFFHGSQDGLPDLPSLADGLVGAVDADSIATGLVKQLMDEIILVSEEEIARAVAYAYYKYGEIIEPSGAVTLAVVLRERMGRNPRVAVVSGGNVQPEVHARIIAEYAQENWE